MFCTTEQLGGFRSAGNHMTGCAMSIKSLGSLSLAWLMVLVETYQSLAVGNLEGTPFLLPLSMSSSIIAGDSCVFHIMQVLDQSLSPSMVGQNSL